MKQSKHKQTKKGTNCTRQTSAFPLFCCQTKALQRKIKSRRKKNELMNKSCPLMALILLDVRFNVLSHRKNAIDAIISTSGLFSTSSSTHSVSQYGQCCPEKIMRSNTKVIRVSHRRMRCVGGYSKKLRIIV